MAEGFLTCASIIKPGGISDQKSRNHSSLHLMAACIWSLFPVAEELLPFPCSIFLLLQEINFYILEWLLFLFYCACGR